MKSKLFLLLTTLAVFVGGGTALAAPAIDTLLTAGYDPEEMTLVFGASSTYDENSPFAVNNTNSLDCRLVGDFVYELDTEAEEDADSVPVTGLTPAEDDGPADATSATSDDDGDTWFFQEDEDAEEADALDPVQYGDEGAEECNLTAVNVGEDANHGKVVSAFVHAIKDMGYKGAGCMLRFVSQSDWGKEELDETGGTTSTDLTVTLEAFEASCNHGKKGDTEDEGGGSGHGKPPWAGPDGDKSLKPGKGPKADD